MLLEATNLGLGSPWCGVYPFKERMKVLSKLIQLSDNEISYALIHFGYPDEKLEHITQYDPKKIHTII